jgi:hypothetical protein
MTILRRAVPVLAAMIVAMTLSSCVLRALGRTEAIDAVGFLFAVGVWLALLASKPWHGVRGEPALIFPAVFVVSISFPVLLRATHYLISAFAALGAVRSMPVAMYVPMMLTSAIGARLVAAGMSWATGRPDRLLRRTMTAWGACWPLLHFPIGLPTLDQGSLLLWHLPIGLACSAWVLRAPQARYHAAT